MKRVFDVTVAGAALVVTAPLLDGETEESRCELVTSSDLGRRHRRR